MYYIFRYALVTGDELSTDWTQLSEESHSNPLLCLSMKCHGLRLHDRLQCLYTYCFTDMQVNQEATNQKPSSNERRHFIDDSETPRQADNVDVGMEEVRSKKWQYSDPLQVCISTYCNGRRQSSFYQCVYNRCIAKKDREEREEEREERRRRRR